MSDSGDRNLTGFGKSCFGSKVQGPRWSREELARPSVQSLMPTQISPRYELYEAARNIRLNRIL